MPIKKTSMKNIAFYSGFSYLREIDSSYFQSADNGFGAQEINGTYNLPANVYSKPPYIEVYFVHNSDLNTRYSLSQTDQISIGVTTTQVKATGYVIPRISYSGAEPPFRLYFIIYGTKV